MAVVTEPCEARAIRIGEDTFIVIRLGEAERARAHVDGRAFLVVQLTDEPNRPSFRIVPVDQETIESVVRQRLRTVHHAELAHAIYLLFRERFLEAVRRDGTIAERRDVTGWTEVRISAQAKAMLLVLDIDHVHDTHTP